MQSLHNIELSDRSSRPESFLSLSAGVGRTGCFIVIDAMLERIRHERSVDIYGHVTLMRSQRNYMVQTEDQYSFIHEALLEAVACGNTEVAARSLYSYMQKLSKVESGEHVTGMELEFKVQMSPVCVVYSDSTNHRLDSFNVS